MFWQSTKRLAEVGHRTSKGLALEESIPLCEPPILRVRGAIARRLQGDFAVSEPNRHFSLSLTITVDKVSTETRLHN